MATGPSAVDVDLGVHVDALEVETQRLVLILAPQRERLAIAAASRGQIAAVVARRCVGIERALDAPVVGQADCAPLRRVASQLAVVLQEELPVGVEQLFAFDRLGQCRR